MLVGLGASLGKGWGECVTSGIISGVRRETGTVIAIATATVTGTAIVPSSLPLALAKLRCLLFLSCFVDKQSLQYRSIEKNE